MLYSTTIILPNGSIIVPRYLLIPTLIIHFQQGVLAVSWDKVISVVPLIFSFVLEFLSKYLFRLFNIRGVFMII